MEGNPSDQNENRNSTGREWQNPNPIKYESPTERKRKYDYLAKIRTSRFMVRLMAGMAVRVASRKPPQQENTMM